jgi:hypothetical protein
MATKDVTIYPVGLLQALSQFVHAVDRDHARRKLVHSLRYVLTQARARNWNAVRNYFNGYLAEHAYAGSRAGTGWTRGRAYRDLARHLADGQQ